MRIDFYQLTRDPPHLILPAIAQNVMKAGGRLLVISDAEALPILSKSLWAFRDDSFLAHDIAADEANNDGADNSAQPILLSTKITHISKANMIAICDGIWREEALKFDRSFYMFSPNQIEDARTLWRKLMQADGAELHYWKQEGRGWIEGPSKT